MQANEAAAFGAVISALARSFRVEPDEALVEGYWMGLEDLSLDGVKMAVREAIRSSEFMPKPVELRRLAGETTPGERAAKAWAEVLVLARNSRNAEHPDPAVESLVRRLGGWLKIGQTDEAKLDFMRRDFVDLFTAEDRRTAAPEIGAPERKALKA